MADEQRRSGVGEGIRTGLGILNAFREAIEETFQEAVDRGELSPDRARKAMQDAAQRLQAGFDDARERIDFVTQREHAELRSEVAALRERVEQLESASRPDLGPEGEASGIIVTE